MFLLPEGADLRVLRAKILEENIIGFYDERPGKKRLYAVSAERKLTPANQLILSHELRHALQDQYADLHGMIPQSVGDFDDRRMAFLSVLEGDATLVMERFLIHRLGGEKEDEVPPYSLPTPPMPDVPPVLRDQLLLPYFAGRDFAMHVHKKGGWEALRQAWGRPPQSTEQVLHPEKYDAREAPRTVDLSYAPGRGRAINEGVLGECSSGPSWARGRPAGARRRVGGDHSALGTSRARPCSSGARSGTPQGRARVPVRGEARWARCTRPGAPAAGTDLRLPSRWVAVGERASGIDLISSDDQPAFESALAALGGS